MGNPNPLSDTLRRLRKEAGLSGVDAARVAGLTQSKVSRAETGAFLPSEQEVEALCRVYKAPVKVRKELVRLVQDLREETTSARVVLQRGGWWMQQRIGKLEAAASLIRTFTTTVIVGLLQTEDYIRALFGDSLAEDDRERTISARLLRQHVITSERTFHFVMAEGALRWNMGGAAVMAEQCDRLVELSRLDNLRLGIIPWTTPTTVPATHGFTMYDSTAVLLGTQTATAIIKDRQNLDGYEAHWAELEPLASYGDDARAVIERVAADYRSTL